MKDFVSQENFINKKKAKILDIGCNDGSLLDIFHKRTHYLWYRTHRCRKRGKWKHKILNTFN